MVTTKNKFGLGVVFVALDEFGTGGRLLLLLRFPAGAGLLVAFGAVDWVGWGGAEDWGSSAVERFSNPSPGFTVVGTLGAIATLGNTDGTTGGATGSGAGLGVAFKVAKVLKFISAKV